MGRLLLKMLVGALAGLIVWAVLEPTRPAPYTPEWQQFEFKLVLSLGALIGLAVGGVDGLLVGGKFHALRGAGLGLLLGSIGAPLGYTLGSTLAAIVFGRGLMPEFPAIILWRVVALAPLGIFLGAAIGASSLAPRKIAQGAIGGAIGAGVGAVIFDLIGNIIAPTQIALEGAKPGSTAEVGSISRMVYCLAVGGAIGLFIGIIERVARSAWVRLAVGRNEGKEWSIDLPQNFIGRSERAQVPIFGDDAIAPMHACIARHPGGYMLQDGGAGTLLNGHPVAQAPLNSGDQITVGRTTLTFLLKGSPAPYRPPEHMGAMAFSAAQHAAPPTQGVPVPQQPRRALGLIFVAMDGPLSGKRFPIAASCDLGRESQAIPLAFDTMSSRRHARLEVHSGNVTLTDLNSTNGTFVNGQPIATQALHPGDLVKIGATTFRVESE